ncbi:hypothetical protein D3C72_1781440 [compost metagenome]
MSFGDVALEGRILQRMIFDMHGQAFDLGVQRGPLGHRPTFQGTIEFQAKVVMQVRRVMLLDAELQRMGLGGFPACALDGGGLGRRREVAHAVVVIEVSGHGSPAACAKTLNQNVSPKQQSKPREQ